MGPKVCSKAAGSGRIAIRGWRDRSDLGFSESIIQAWMCGSTKASSSMQNSEWAKPNASTIAENGQSGSSDPKYVPSVVNTWFKQ